MPARHNPTHKPEVMFADSKVLVTGGTGSFGKALIGRLCRSTPRPDGSLYSPVTN